MTTETRQRHEVWQERISQQRQSRLSVKAFCQKHGVCEQSFYSWRKRLNNDQPLKFALVETNGSEAKTPDLELILASGDRLQIPAGVDEATLRAVLALLRERS